ncbi:MAG: hypothetical protein WBB94_01750 [Candidatus Saccharimonadaceae bacterium]
MTSLIKRLLIALVLTIAGLGIYSSVQPTEASASSCVAGKDRGDFKGVWLSKDTVNVKTRSGGKLCKDTVIYVSSYSMPANYDGGEFFGNSTAYPQYKFATKAVTLKAGTDGNVTVTIAVPDECTNYQADAYVGPEVTVVGEKGHMGRTIKAQIVQKTKSDCTPEVVKVKTCDTTTMQIVEVEKGKENTAPYSTDLSKCKSLKVCDTTTGKIVIVTESESKNAKYSDVDSSKCKDQPKTPEVLPQTGPTETLLAALPFGAITAASTYYIRKRN